MLTPKDRHASSYALYPTGHCPLESGKTARKVRPGDLSTYA